MWRAAVYSIVCKAETAADANGEKSSSEAAGSLNALFVSRAKGLATWVQPSRIRDARLPAANDVAVQILARSLANASSEPREQEVFPDGALRALLKTRDL